MDSNGDGNIVYDLKRHFVKLPSKFQKYYVKLLHYDERLRNLSTKPFPSWPSIITPTWLGGFRGPPTSNIRTFEAQGRAGGPLQPIQAVKPRHLWWKPSPHPN
ncbi:hypothetical protein AMTR_s00003p00011730 [Amborella trichopoda]|uniref:Uncharacterized protein n=1 Tax=Amborella trichopoda TaxID=13333 RepID=W1P7W5_AMBTC|nr:hypothetical protein AMTR_s00003p00011730 [Amborella trichopoda]